MRDGPTDASGQLYGVQDRRSTAQAKLSWVVRYTIDGLARFVMLALEHGAKAPDGLRVYLYSALAPDSEGQRQAAYEKWLAKNCLTLGELDRERIADIDRRLALKLDGSPMAANTANRIRIIARASVQAAMKAGAVAADAWPQRSKSRACRKVARAKRSVEADGKHSTGQLLRTWESQRASTVFP